MRFANLFAGLGLVSLLSFAHFTSNLFAQEEFVQDAPPPPTDGLFDDDLEPLDEVQPQPHGSSQDAPDDVQMAEPDRDREPEPQPTVRNNDRSSGKQFPSARTIPASKNNGKGLPPLPGGMKVPNENEKLRMDFVQVDIEEVVKYFAERLQRRFIYDPSMLTGKITIISPTDVTLREAWAAFLSAMEVRGYIVFPAGAFLKIEKAANARKSPVPVITGDSPNDDSFVTRIINLKFLSVNDIRQAVRNLLSRTAGDVIEHAPTNTLIISDYAFNIRRIVRILNILDVEAFQEQIAVIPLKHASAADLARKVTEFFPSGAAANAGNFRTRGAAPRAVGGATASAAQQSIIQKIVPDERTNSLILLGSERGIDQVKKFIEQMDVPVEGGGGQIHVYHLQNVKAEDISQTLAALTSGARSGRAGTPSVPVAQPGGVPSTSAASGATTATLLNGDVKITADVPTNALVIQASPRDFEVLKTIIQKLDIRRRQVFIESAILEAKVGRGSSFGTQASGPFAQTQVLGQKPSATDSTVKKVDSAGVFSIGSLAQSLDTLLQNPAQLTGLALGFRSGGTYDISVTNENGDTVTRKVPLLSAIIRLSANSEKFNVLSTPHILATANEEATISIGQEIPQITGSTTTEGGATTRNYTRVRVATELNITPQINADDYLTLKIKQKVNSVGTQSDDGQYNTINREATTTAIVKDQQTIVIGGLMEDRRTVTERKVPFLGDIPILGWLFKSRDTTNEKANLLLFLTPHIIKDTANLNDQFFRKLKEREKFLKDLGMSEQTDVPVSGLTEDQVNMLDPEYVKSLKLMKIEPLPTKPEDSSVAPAAPTKIEPQDRPHPPAIPVPAQPRQSAPEDDDSLTMPAPTPDPESPSAAPPPELEIIEPAPQQESLPPMPMPGPSDDGELPPLTPIKS